MEVADTSSNHLQVITLSDHVETLLLTGNDDIDGTGNNLNNFIEGNSGNNTLTGGIGFDHFAGRDGDDTYIINGIGQHTSNAGQNYESSGFWSITENRDEGSDHVYSSFNHNLNVAHIEYLTLTGSDDIYGYGSEQTAVTITGNSGANALKVWGANNELTGGTGIDSFEFNGHNSRPFNSINTITDFEITETIKLSKLDNIVSIAKGDGAAIGLGDIEYFENSGDTFLYIGTDVNAGGDATIRLKNFSDFEAFYFDENILRKDYINDAPTVTSTAITSITSGEAYSYTITATDQDYQDTFTFSASTLPGWLSLNSATGVLSGTPGNNHLGDNSVSLRVTDEAGLFENHTFNVTVEAEPNSAPTVSSSAVTSGQVNAQYNYTFSGTDPDTDDTIIFTSVTLPDWLTFNTSNGLLTGTPDSTDLGNNSVTLRIRDNGGLYSDQSFTINVAPDPSVAPTVNSTPITLVTRGQEYAYTLTASDENAGDTLTYSSVTLPSWLIFNSTTGILSGTPNQSNVGDHSVTLRATDQSGLFENQNFEISVNEVPNSAPIVTSTPITTVVEGSLYNYYLTGSDSDTGDEINFQNITLPGWLELNPTSGLLSGTPGEANIGNNSVSLRVYDKSGDYGEQSFNILVSEAEDINSVATGSVYITGPNYSDGIGSQYVGQTLTANASEVSDLNGINESSISYQWFRRLTDEANQFTGDDLLISGATSQNYTLVNDDFGTGIRVKYSFSDNIGTAEEIISPLVDRVLENSVPTGSTIISGIGQRGNILTADVSSIQDRDGINDSTFSYQWYRGDDQISGAVSNTYELIATDDEIEGPNNVSVKFTYTDNLGITSSLKSVPFHINSFPNESGDMVTQHTWLGTTILHARTDTVHDDDGINDDTVEYQWYRDDNIISGEIYNYYYLSDEDASSQISVQLSYTDNYGTHESLRSNQIEVPELSNTAPELKTLSGTVHNPAALEHWHQLFIAEDGDRVTDILSDRWGQPKDFVTISGIDLPSWISIEFTPDATPQSTYYATLSGTPQLSDIGSHLVSLRATDELGAFSDYNFTLTVNEIANTPGYTTPDWMSINGPAGKVTTGETYYVGQNLQASAIVSDLDGIDESTISYQWYRKIGEIEVAIEGASDQRYDLTEDDVNAQIRYSYSYTDYLNTTEVIFSPELSLTIKSNSAPTGTVAILGNGKRGETLTTDITDIKDNDGIDISTITYQWYRGDDLILGATNSSYQLVAEDDETLGSNVVSVEFNYTDFLGAATSIASPAFHVNSLPNETANMVSGIGEEGERITATYAHVNDDDGINESTVAYQWYRGNNIISGENNSYYDLIGDDAGRQISVKLSYTDDFGSSEVLRSNLIKVENAEAISHTNTLPEPGTALISLLENDLLNADIENLFDVDGIDISTLTYQWYRGDTAISGNGTHELVTADEGKTLKYVVSYTDDYGTNESLTSQSYLVNNKPEIVGTVIVKYNDTFFANRYFILDLDEIDADTITYQWKIGENLLLGETSSNYDLNITDVGENLKVSISYLDLNGNLETVNSEALTVQDLRQNTPTINTTAPENAISGETYNYTVTGFDLDTEDNLTFSTSTLPNWLAFDIASGILSGTPGDADFGDHDVTIRLTDQTGLYAEQSFNIFVQEGGLDLNSSELLNQNLQGVDYSYADLTGSDLSGADLTGANLVGANLSGADLTDTILTGANLIGLKTEGIIGTPILPSEYRLINGYILGAGVDIANGDLSNLGNFSVSEFDGLDLSHSNLSRVNLSGTSIFNANLSNANLSGVNFQDGHLLNSNIDQTDFTNANFTDLRQDERYIATDGKLTGSPILPDGVIINNGFLIGSELNLSNLNLSNINLEGFTFNETKLENANFSLTNLSGSTLSNIFGGAGNFNEANLSNSNISDSTILYSSFTGTQWQNTTFKDVVFQSGNFTNSNFIDSKWTDITFLYTSLSNVSFNNSTLENVDFTQHTTLDNLTFTNSKLINSGFDWYTGNDAINFSNAEISNSSFSNSTLSNSDFSNAKLFNSSMGGSNLKNANFTNSELIYDNSYVDGHWLDTDLSNANFTNAHIDGLVITPSLDLSDANLTNVSTVNLQWYKDQLLPENYFATQGYLWGPNLNFIDVDLSTISDSYKNYNGKNFSGTNFTRADLTGFSLNNTNLSNTDFTDAIMQDVQLAYTNLSDANLTGADITNAYLAYTNFTNANLSGVDFSKLEGPMENIILTNANLDNAIFLESEWGNLSVVQQAQAKMVTEVAGTEESETLIGDENFNLISGNSGDDIINGNNGDDVLSGNNNNDIINGDNGNDILNGGYDDDILRGGSGNDILNDGFDKDLIMGQGGNDTINLVGNNYFYDPGQELFAHNVGSINEVGTDVRISLQNLTYSSNQFLKLETVIDGGSGLDTINLNAPLTTQVAFFLDDAYSGFHSSLSLNTDANTGTQSTQRILNVETINGREGNDIIDLTSANYSLAGQVITINAGGGDDVIWGSAANENINGGYSNDIIFGGSGDDTLTGGPGPDIFEFTITAGSDTITDYSKSDGDVLKIYRRDQYEGDKEATISSWSCHLWQCHH